MKLYRDYPLAAVSFSADPQFALALERFVGTAGVDVIIETGTYLGLGSTQILARFFQKTRPPKRFLTMEVNWRHFKHAKVNLRAFDFVDCRWGSSVTQAEALRFIETDDAIKNHHHYPEIWIDDVGNPAAFYAAEISGTMLHQQAEGAAHPIVNRIAGLFGIGDFSFLWNGDGLLARACSLHKHHRPLIVLDSAGGVGFLEFQIALNIMQDVEYMLLLDDVHHLKHFRSLRHIQNDPAFEMLAMNLAHGWALARHRGKSK